MHRIAWKSLRKNGGIGRASINHFTTDNKKTLCDKDIPSQIFCLDAFGPNDCDKCFRRKAIADELADKPKYFIEIIKEFGGHYECKDRVHKASWDGDRKNQYLAYGRITPLMDDGDKLEMIDNFILLELKSGT